MLPDFPYTIESMSKLIDTLLIGTDVVVATRDKSYYAYLPLLRRMASCFVRMCNRYLLRMEFSDTQAGLKGFSQFGRDIFLSTKINSYLFDWEFVYKAGKDSSILMKDVLVKLRNDVAFSQITLTSYLKELKYYKWNLFT